MKLLQRSYIYSRCGDYGENRICLQVEAAVTMGSQTSLKCSDPGSKGSWAWDKTSCLSLTLLCCLAVAALPRASSSCSHASCVIIEELKV